jgi:3-hydroxyacyl-CoA dehydrogenase / enoyl-CoA hydratase / 3-hydroxybutyryl-CoA epimerase / enoyl-CoA isomerase
MTRSFWQAQETAMIYQGYTLSLAWLEDGIVKLEFDRVGPVNTLDTNTITSLSEALDHIDRLDNLRGMVITSAKSAFIAGADIKEFLTLFAAPLEQIQHWLRFANTQFNRLEDLAVPVVVAVDGYALGGGCELILACDYRVATEKARIGLPETRLGIIPGFGGTVRLPRLIGNDNALELITAAKEVDGLAALKLGLVDAVVSQDNLLASAIKVLKLAINQQDWPSRRLRKTEPLPLNKLESKMSFMTAKALVLQKAGRHYPAPIEAINCIETAAKETRAQALEIEMSHFIPLAKSETAKALIGIFLNEQSIKASNRKLSKDSAQPSMTAVLGAGIMGGGIAWQAASKGFAVKMKDIQPQALQAGLDEAGKLSLQQLARNKTTPAKMLSLVSQIQPQLDYSGFDQVELVVEAVVENQKIKAQVLRETEQQLPKHAILTSNTSTIPITELAKNLQDPTRFCGLHFFNPVPRMPLVEVIRGQETAPETISKAVSWAMKIGKTPIVVNDCPGFFVNRVLFPYFAGFSLLIKDGVDYQRIDKVMERQFGWPMGPAWLLDVVGLDTAHHAQQVMAAGFPDRMQLSDNNAVDQLFASGRLGQKNKQGFWLWQEDKKGKLCKQHDPEVDHLLQLTGQTAANLSDDEIIERMMIPMVNEVVRCLEEKIIDAPGEADLALVYGLGFPPFRGGVFRYLDNLTNQRFIQSAARWQHLGGLYHPPKMLLEKAQQQDSWYPQPAPLTINNSQTA